MREKLLETEKKASAKLDKIQDQQLLEQFRVSYLGKKGIIDLPGILVAKLCQQ